MSKDKTNSTINSTIGLTKDLIQNDLNVLSYDWIKYRNSDIKSLISEHKKQIQNIIDEVKNINTENRSFRNTVYKIEEDTSLEIEEMSFVGVFALIHEDKEIRDLVRDVEMELSEFYTNTFHDEELFNSFKNYYLNNFKKEKSKLKKDEIKLVEDSWRGWKKMGFNLAKKDQNLLKKIEVQISKLCTKYDTNVNENNDYILVEEKDLGNMPQNLKDVFEKVDGKIKVTLKYPSYNPFMRYSPNEKLREKIYIKFQNIGSKENVKILQKLYALRDQKAKLLGYRNHAEFVLEERMAKKTKIVRSLINNVIKSSKTFKQNELKELTNFAKEEITWTNFNYWTNLYRESKFAYSEAEVREYFELNNTLTQMFDLFGTLFGFEMKEIKAHLWNKEVRAFELYDIKTKKKISNFIVDLYPREGKYGHACMTHIDRETALIICNFSKSNLLNLSEVETLCHEFGHALHHLLSKVEMSSQFGTSVVRDFVELPSQLLENWLFEEKVLSKITKHFQTGVSMPKVLINKIVASRKLNQGIHYTRQSILALIDLNLYELGNVDLIKEWHDLNSKYLMPELDKAMFVSHFSHIVSGYDVGYYSYMFAEVMALDVFGEFKKVGIFNKNLGRKYRKEILEVGSSRDEEESLESLLGRKLNTDALVASL